MLDQHVTEKIGLANEIGIGENAGRVHLG